MIKKIKNRIEISRGQTERPKISVLKRKHLILTSSTDRKKIKNLTP